MKSKILFINVFMGLVFLFILTFSFIMYFGADYNQRYHESFIAPTFAEKGISLIMLFSFLIILFIVNYRLTNKRRILITRILLSLLNSLIAIFIGIVIGIFTGILPGIFISLFE